VTSPSVIAALEDALAEARAGTITAVAVAAVYDDGCLGHSWSDATPAGTLLESIGSLGADYVREGVG